MAAPPDGLTDVEVARRIAILEDRLDRGTPAATRWWAGWYAGFTVLTVGQAALAIGLNDKGKRTDYAIGAMASSLGVIPLGVFGFVPRHAAADLRAAPARTAEERRAKLALGERLLEKSATTESFGQSWITHALGATVSIGAGLVLAFGYDRHATGIFNGVAGIAIVEAQIWTEPEAAITDWRNYLRDTGRPIAASAVRGASSIRFVPSIGGGALVGRF